MKTSDCKHYCIKFLLMLVMNLLLILVIYPGIYAARIDGPANMRESPKGKAIISLKNDIYVDCDCEFLKDNMYLIGITIRLEPEYHDAFFIKEGQRLYDLDGVEIGKALETFKIEYHYVTKDGKRFGEIIAYTHKNNIKKNSILENALNNILSRKDTELTLSDLADHIKEFRYHSWIDHNEFKTFIYSDPWMVTETPGARSILIFYRKQFVAIIHPGYLNIISKNTKKLVWEYQITYVESLDNKTATELEEFYRNIIVTAN